MNNVYCILLAYRTKLTQLNADEVNKFIKEGVLEINGEKLTNNDNNITINNIALEIYIYIYNSKFWFKLHKHIYRYNSYYGSN